MPRKSPDKPERAEKVRAKKPAKKETTAEDAVAQAILAETASKVEQMNVAQSVEDALCAFFDSHKIGITTGDVSAIIKNTVGCTTITTRAPNHACEFILYQLIDVFGARSGEEYKDGNLYDSLKYLVLVLACVKLSGAKLPLKYCNSIASIEKRLTPGGRFETLFERIRPFFYELVQSQLEVIGEHIALTDNIGRLLAEARVAEMTLRWQDSIRLRRELIQLNPAHPANYTRLSIALENTKQYKEALEAIETAVRLPTYRELPHCQGATLRRIKKLRELACNPAPQSAPPEKPDPPAHPKPPERKTETTLRYEQYLASVQQDSSNWPAETADGGGSGWRKVPEDQLNILQKIFSAFEKKMMTAGLHKQDKLSYRQLKTLLEQIDRGVINEHTLRRCAEECGTGPSRSVQIIKEDALR